LVTELLIETQQDFDLFDRCRPTPSGVDGTPIRDVLDRLGDRGFVRGGLGNLSSNKAMA
jgi:hypothetical protein